MPVNGRNHDKFVNHLRDIGYNYILSGEDGNCLFNSISIAITVSYEYPRGHEGRHFQLRQDCVDYILDNPYHILDTLVDFDLHDYAERMRQPKIWGGQPEIVALTEVLNMDILIFREDHLASWFQLDQYLPSTPTRVLPPLAIAYNGYNHYNALIAVPLEDVSLKKSEYDIMRFKFSLLSVLI
jgi:OTU domain-containing protein 6